MSPRSRSSEAGFTLIEALAAFTILALVLIAAFRSTAAALQVQERADFHRRASLFARSKLAGVGLVEPVPDRPTQGNFGDRFRWNLSAVPYGEAAGGAKLAAFWVTVTVMREAPSGGTERLALSTLKLVEP